jgi:hypothetical protein
LLSSPRENQLLRSRHGITVLLVALAGCTGHGGGSWFSTTGGAGVSPATSAGGTPAPRTSSASVPPPPPPHVALTQRGIAIDGKVRPLLGGELQYFRARDPNWDVAATWQLWEDALDQFQAAGGTLVSTYVPWDFHESQPGQIDFTGVRDLDHFLECCWKRGLLVAIKPGPFINAEWPYGLGSFGAVPQWWKDAHPDALAKQPNGVFFTVDLLGRPQGRQPSFFSPDFRQAAAGWFAAVAPIIQKYIKQRPTIIMVQVDNETNFYFKSRFSSDYSDWGKKQYSDWLQKKYGSLVGINTDPPTGQGDNQRVQDWFDAGWDGIAEYQAFLRATWESLGIKEPDVLFTTNDSPHPMPTMDLLMWDAKTKSQSGVASIDAYPKQFPWSFDKPSDYPFLTSFFTKRFMSASGTKGALAAEIEGGLFDLPLGIQLDLPVSATDHVLFEFFGHGGVAGTVYTFRGGLNLDNTRYFEMACLDEHGIKTPRYDCFARWAQNVVNQDLIASQDVESPFALIVGAHFDAPMAGVNGHPGWVQGKEAPGIFGWLEDAGIEPVVLDGANVKKGDLDKYQGVLYVDPDAAEADLAQALDDYVQRGGVLVNLLGMGSHDADWQPTNVLTGGLFSDGTLLSAYEETLGYFLPPHVNYALPGGPSGTLTTSPFLGHYQLGSGADVIAYDSTFPLGLNGAPAGWRARKGQGEVIFLGTSPGRGFRDFSYFDVDKSELLAARSIGRWIASEAKVGPILEVEDAKAQAFARKGPALVFVASREDHQDDVVVRVLDLKALGLDPAKTYQLTDVLNGVALGSSPGADLVGNGFHVSLGPWETAVVSIR